MPPLGDGSGDRDPILRTRYDWSETAPSIAVVSAIAAIEGVDPTELNFDTNITMSEYVDLDGLDRLVTHSDRPVVVSFTVEDYRVRIERDELIVAFR